MDIWKTINSFRSVTHAQSECCMYDSANKIILTPVSNRVYIPFEVSELCICNWYGSGRMWEGKRVDIVAISQAYEDIQCPTKHDDGVLLFLPLSYNAIALGWIVMRKYDNCVCERLVCMKTALEPFMVHIIERFLDAFPCSTSCEWVVDDPKPLLHAVCCYVGAIGSLRDFSFTGYDAPKYCAHARALSSTLACSLEAQKEYLQTQRVCIRPTIPHTSTQIPMDMSMFMVSYPFGGGYISYGKWDEGTTYMHFMPYKNLQPELDMFWNISISQNATNDTHLQCSIVNTDIKRGAVMHYMSNDLYIPLQKITSPYINFAFAQCGCKDKTHYKNIAAKAIKVGLYGVERVLLSSLFAQLSNKKAALCSSQSIDALLAIENELNSDERSILCIKLFGVEESPSLSHVIQSCRAELFDAVQRRLEQPLLARAIFTQIVGDCPMKRIRYDAFILSLSTFERVLLLNEMCTCVQSHSNVYEFCKKNAILLCLLFRTMHFDAILHANQIYTYIRGLTFLHDFYQMHFSFQYASDALLWDGMTLGVTWVRQSYTFHVYQTKEIQIQHCDPYMVHKGDEYIRSNNDVLYIRVDDEKIIQEPPSMLHDEEEFIFMADDGTFTNVQNVVMKRCGANVSILCTHVYKLELYYMIDCERLDIGVVTFPNV